MPIPAQTAKKLCNKTEYELYQAARADDVKQLTDARLKSKLDRARKLRDKWRDESKRQLREARGKAGPRGTRASEGADNTKKKAQLFDEVLAKFQAETERRRKSRVKRTSAAQKRSGVPKSVRGGSGKGKSGGAGKSKVKPSAKPKRARKKAEDKRARYAKAGVKRTQAHISSRGKRSQASRDIRTSRGRGG